MLGGGEGEVEGGTLTDVILVAEHRVQAEGAAPGRRRRRPDGRSRPLPLSQQHLSPIGGQHPRALPSGGECAPPPHRSASSSSFAVCD